MELAKKVAVYIREHKLIEPGDRVLAALSGGADSVCLTLILNGLQTELGFTLSACHINHSLRGEESEADQAFVEDLCLRLRIPLTVVRVDVKGCAAEQGIGIEAAARLLRYETFEKLSDQRGFNKTALAHNRNDQAETILFRFLRGSSSKGLAGMRPMRDGRYIRPLLHTDRQTIEDFLQAAGESYRTDSSNLTEDYTRNSLRLNLIPTLAERYNPDIVNTLADTGEIMAADADYLEGASHELYARYAEPSPGKITLGRELFSEHRALVSRTVLAAAEELTGTRQNLGKVHIEDILKLQAGETGKTLDLPLNLKIINSYGDITLCLTKGVTAGPVKANDVCPVDLSDMETNAEPLQVEFGSYGFTFRVKAMAKDAILGAQPTGPGQTETFQRVALDYAKAGGRLTIRTRQSGDKIRLKGVDGRKSVKSIFIDRKIPRDLRDQLPLVLAENGEIAYIHPGIIARSFRPDDATEKIIYMEIRQLPERSAGKQPWIGETVLNQ